MKKLLLAYVASAALLTCGQAVAASYVCDNLTPANCVKPLPDGSLVTAGGNSYKNIAGAATTVVKSGSGYLHLVTLNTFVASATITVYDNTAGSGTKIASIVMGSAITGDAPDEVMFDVAFSTGLTIVTTGAIDITASYR